MKKFLLLVFAVLAVVLLAAWITGSQMPREHVASSRLRLRQPVETVWAAVTDHAAMTSWRTGLKQAERGPDQDGKAVWIEEISFDAIPMRVEESSPPSRYVLAIADQELPFGGTWTYAITPVDGGSEIVITEDGFVQPALFRLLSKYAFGHHATMDQYLTDLAKKFGEAGLPEHLP